MVKKSRFVMLEKLSLGAVLLANFLICGGALAAGGEKKSITPPVQPSNGPGGAEVTYAEVEAQKYGQGAQAYWIFKPKLDVNTKDPVKLPVVVFCHGWGALEPAPYSAWIDHIVSRGNIVIFPMYQDSLLVPPAEFTPNTIAGIKGAITTLKKTDEKIQPEWDKYAIVGHSMGGVMAVNVAASWESNKLPKPKAIMSVEPGKTWPKGQRATVEMADLRKLPADALLLTVVGDSDTLVFEIDAKRVFRESTSIPAANKNYVRIHSDAHGTPPLKASHYLPLASNGKYRESKDISLGKQDDLTDQQIRQCDALDFYGTWKLFDALSDAAFNGKNRKYALGNTPEQRFMGKWSDGTPVKQLEIVPNP